jgi:hypothetical protein
MINIMKMKLWPLFSKNIAIPVNEHDSYNVIVLSENSDFSDFYPKLNIRRQFIKRISMVAFKNPQVIATTKLLLPYKELGLVPTLIAGKYNTFFDAQPFFNIIDQKYGKQSYKRSIVFQKIIAYFNKIKQFGNAKSILIYHVNLNKPIPESFLYRRSFIIALMAQIGDGDLPFDNVVVASEFADSIKFSSIFNKDMKSLGFQKILSILKRLVSKPKDIEDTQDDNVVAEAIQMIDDNENKESIIRFINMHQKRKVLIS